MPGLDAWCFASHRRQSARVRTSSVIRSPAMVATCPERIARNYLHHVDAMMLGDSPLRRNELPNQQKAHAKEVFVKQHALALSAALTLMNALSARAQPRTSAANTSLRAAVVVLGDGTPVLSADRSGTSIGVVVRGTIYVFDAGPGVLRRLFEAQQRLGLGIVISGRDLDVY